MTEIGAAQSAARLSMLPLLGSFRVFGRLRDVGATMGTEFVVLGGMFIAMRLAAVHWGPTGFGEFVLFRRNIGLLQLPLSCSLALGITRYVALGRAGGRSERAYGLAAVAIVLATLSLGAVVSGVLRGPLAALLFGSSQYVPLLGGLMVAVAGAVLHGVAYGIFRGQLEFGRANVVQLVNVGFLPLLVLSWPGLSVVAVTYWIGGLWTLLAAVQLVVGLRRAEGQVTGAAMAAAARELLAYGLPRVPGEFALSALFTFPLFVLAHRAGIAPAGQLGFAVSLVMLISTAFTPLGVFVLPSVTTRVAHHDVAHLRRDVFRMLLVCAVGAAAGLAVIELAAPVVVVYGLGRDFAEAIPMIRFVLIAALPFVCYVVLRNVLDAASTWPYNARNLLLGVGLFAAIVLVWPSADAVPAAMLASVGFVGGLTIFDTWRLLGALRSTLDG